MCTAAFGGRIERRLRLFGLSLQRAAALRVIKQTIANFIEKASLLYEQERSGPCERDT
jgi:hypothetical protein